MESIKKWLSERNEKKNGKFVHYSPPKLLGTVPASNLRKWARSGTDSKLERAVLSGQGQRLLAEADTLPLSRYLSSLITKCEALHAAVERGSLLDLQELLESDYNRNKLSTSCDEAGVGLLHKAVYYNYVDIVEYLVKYYPHLVYQKDSEGRTPLHYTAASRDEALLAGLLEGAGAARGARDNAGRTLAHYRAARTLLVLPTAVDMPRNNGLVIKRHNIRIWCHECDMGRLQRVVWDGQGSRLLSEVSNQPVVKKFLEAVPYIMNTIKDIHNAVIQNDLESVIRLTSSPVSPQILSSKDANNMTVFHKAAGLGHCGILKYICEKYPQGLNETDNDGRTPLHYAAIVKDDHHTFNTLIEFGADEGAVDDKNKTPAYYQNRPQEIDKNNLKILPEAPRTPSSTYPPSWDWKILDTEYTPDVNKKSKKKHFKSTENISSKTLTESTENISSMKNSSTHELINNLPELNDKENEVITEEIADELVNNEVNNEKNDKNVNSTVEINKTENIVKETENNLEDTDLNDEQLDQKDSTTKPCDTDEKETKGEMSKEPDKDKDIETVYENQDHVNDAQNDNNEVLLEEVINNTIEKTEHKVEDENPNPNEESENISETVINETHNNDSAIVNQEENLNDDSHNDNNLIQDSKANGLDIVKSDLKDRTIESPNNLDRENIENSHETHSSPKVSENETKESRDEHDNISENSNQTSISGHENGITNQSKTETLDKIEMYVDKEDTAVTDEGSNGRISQESLIEGVVSGEAEKDSQDASLSLKEDSVQRDIFIVDSQIDPEVTELINTSNMEMLATLVLNGEGSRLAGRHSDNPEVQAFLENVPTYMQKINRVHIAATEGNIRELQAALDRRKFAIARDPISANGATPLHVATVFGKTNIVKYLGGRFPETLSAVDFEGRTALHYAAVLPDNGHYYNLLQQLGSNSKDLDDNGRSADDYYRNPDLLPFNQLLNDFGITDEVMKEMFSDKGVNTTNGHLDIPIFHTEEGRYLAKSLGDPLIKGLTEVANVKPKDPIAFLATFLHNFPDHEKPRLGTQETTTLVTREAPEFENELPAPNDDQDRPKSSRVRSSRIATRPTRPIDVITVDPNQETSPDVPEDASSSPNRDEHGQSMLHFAAARSHANNALFQLLQETDVSLGYRDELYRTARDISIQANVLENTGEIDRFVLHLAARGNTDKIMELLMQGYDHILDVVDEDGVPISEVIAQRGDSDMSNLLASIPSFEESRDRLHMAIRRGDISEVQKLSGEGGRTLARAHNTYGRTAMHVAVLAQYEDIVTYLAEHYPELLTAGDNLERTPLHYAMGVEKMESLSRILTKAGAKRVLKDLKGRQPTYYFMNKSDILRLKEEEEMY